MGNNKKLKIIIIIIILVIAIAIAAFVFFKNSDSGVTPIAGTANKKNESVNQSANNNEVVSKLLSNNENIVIGNYNNYTDGYSIKYPVYSDSASCLSIDNVVYLSTIFYRPDGITYYEFDKAGGFAILDTTPLSYTGSYATPSEFYNNFLYNYIKNNEDDFFTKFLLTEKQGTFSLVDIKNKNTYNLNSGVFEEYVIKVDTAWGIYEINLYITIHNNKPIMFRYINSDVSEFSNYQTKSEIETVNKNKEAIVKYILESIEYGTVQELMKNKEIRTIGCGTETIYGNENEYFEYITISSMNGTSEFNGQYYENTTNASIDNLIDLVIEKLESNYYGEYSIYQEGNSYSFENKTVGTVQIKEYTLKKSNIDSNKKFYVFKVKDIFGWVELDSALTNENIANSDFLSSVLHMHFVNEDSYRWKIEDFK